MTESSPDTVRVCAFLARNGLIRDPDVTTLTPLGGGVSSDIWLAEDGGQRVVVKTPLAALRVAAEWHAPTSRGAAEAAWLAEVGRIIPGACPALLAFDAADRLLAMEYLDPGDTVLWKDELLAGRVDPAVAAAVGDRLGTVHASTAARPELAATFAYRENFVALRMDPYLRRLVPRHPELGNAIERLVATILGHERALVHGDVSPKNILVGPTGPCFVDAETAVWGDPAFDLAFCLNHLLLKTQVPGLPVDLLLASLDALVTAYAARVRWEPAADVLGRVAALLPALLLARVDGKSPVEYFDDAQRAWVRVFALPRIVAPPADITDLVYAWRTEMT